MISKILDYFVFDGKPSTDFGLYTFGLRTLSAPRADVTEITIPGRNGVLHQSNGRYSQTQVEYSVVSPNTWNETDSAVMRVTNLLSYLSSKVGYKRLEDTLRPEEYRMAAYKGGTTPKESVHGDMTGAVIQFDCRPERWLKSGEEPIACTNGMTIYNPTEHKARPLMTLYGTGTITINSTPLQITAANGYTTIDCDLQEAYKGSANCNANLVLSDGVFPVLETGLNTIQISGFSSAEIIPRWYIL